MAGVPARKAYGGVMADGGSQGNPNHAERIAYVYGPQDDRLRDSLDQSLDPRGPEMLFEAAESHLRPRSRILDIGCRDAGYLIRLVQAHDCRGVGLDPVDRNVDRARAAVAEAGLDGRIQIARGMIERIEQPDDHFDFIWCRDVLELVEGLERGLAEAARVLHPGGRMLVYTNVATELLEPREAAMICGPLGSLPRNLDEALLEAAFRQGGLTVVRKDVIGTEWREYEEERAQPVSRELLRLARLRRRRAELVEEHGREAYDLAQASLHWKAYQLLGKLQPTMYVLECTTLGPG
jgi:SAM-dependent methyltransferase